MLAPESLYLGQNFISLKEATDSDQHGYSPELLLLFVRTRPICRVKEALQWANSSMISHVCLHYLVNGVDLINNFFNYLDSCLVSAIQLIK